MAWTKLDDGFRAHPKIIAAGTDGLSLHVCAMTYASQYRTDGFIPDAVVPSLYPVIARPTTVAKKLAKVGLWKRDTKLGGWWIHDFLEYNPDAAASRDGQRTAADKRSEKARKAALARWSKESSIPEPDGILSSSQGEREENATGTGPRNTPESMLDSGQYGDAQPPEPHGNTGSVDARHDARGMPQADAWECPRPDPTRSTKHPPQRSIGRALHNGGGGPPPDEDTDEYQTWWTPRTDTLTRVWQYMADHDLNRARTEGQTIHNPTAWLKTAAANRAANHQTEAARILEGRTRGMHYPLHVEIAEQLDDTVGPPDCGKARADNRHAATLALADQIGTP